MAFVTVPYIYVKKCETYNKKAKQFYPGWARQSAVKTGNDPFFCSKIAEVALAMYLYEDVEYAVDWIIGGRDNGYDVMTREGIRYEVKSTTNMGACFLLWNGASVNSYDDKPFDAFVFAKVKDSPEPNGGYFVSLVGWIDRDEFKDVKIIDETGEKFAKGTWYIHQKLLHSMAEM